VRHKLDRTLPASSTLLSIWAACDPHRREDCPTQWSRTGPGPTQTDLCQVCEGGGEEVRGEIATFMHRAEGEAHQQVHKVRSCLTNKF
jgi:hypothetical protein